MTRLPETPQTPAKSGSETPPKEPILMNWIIIFVTVGLIGLVAHMLTGF